MQVRAAAPHIRVTVEGDRIPEGIMDAIRAEFSGDQIEVRGDDDETVDALQSDWYRETVGLITPGDVIRVYRKNRGMTQAELGRRLGGTARRRIDAIEKGRRGVSAATAKQIADVLGISAERILNPQGKWWESG